ncbi:Diaminopimelate epimerase, partial [hydrothermal vent metagenome]
MQFYKFQANGNDFLLVDDRKGLFSASREEIARFCHRQFGIGADGLILLKSSGSYDFDMVYFNADGRPAEMCGNGGRSIAALAYMKGVAGKEMLFSASDGVHEAKIENVSAGKRIFDVSLKMQDVKEVKVTDDGWFLNTGVPHFVRFVSPVETVDVLRTGREIRNDKRF